MSDSEDECDCYYQYFSDDSVDERRDKLEGRASDWYDIIYSILSPCGFKDVKNKYNTIATYLGFESITDPKSIPKDTFTNNLKKNIKEIAALVEIDSTNRKAILEKLNRDTGIDITNCRCLRSKKVKIYFPDCYLYGYSKTRQHYYCSETKPMPVPPPANIR